MIVQVVDEILVPLPQSFEDVTVLLDGIDQCEQSERGLLWTWLEKVLDDVPLRLLISCQDDVQMAAKLCCTNRIRIDLDLNNSDIDIYLEEQIRRHSQPGHLMDDARLCQVVAGILKSTAKGI